MARPKSHVGPDERLELQRLLDERADPKSPRRQYLEAKYPEIVYRFRQRTSAASRLEDRDSSVRPRRHGGAWLPEAPDDVVRQYENPEGVYELDLDGAVVEHGPALFQGAAGVMVRGPDGVWRQRSAARKSS